MKKLLKNDLIQSWIIFSTVLLVLVLVTMFITPRKSVYLNDSRSTDENAVNKTVCRCIGLKDPLNETTPDRPFYEERCMGLVLMCETVDINLPND